ncbi:Vanillate O-demethylase oxidoreductase [Burkholderiales bacterium 8X]|nr:Vanillate O-demethylase oxidoreductase [Burkholderiales bacterium 8X]
MSAERMLTLRVERITRQTPDILAFELVHPWGRALPGYEAGAHVEVWMPGGFARPYSLAAAPDRSRGRYLIGVKREAASRGGSAAMHERVKEGDLICASSPRNTFPIANGARHHLLLAGGIGLTPLLAMAEALLEAGEAFTLCVFARSTGHLAFAGALNEPGLAPHVRLHLDDGTPEQKIDLVRLLAEHEPGRHLYLCGPGGFMAAVRRAASAWPEDSIHAEFFAAPEGGDAASAGKAFSLELTRSNIRVPVASGQSAVEALHEVGIVIPVSCEQGLCGTCVVDAEGEQAEHRDHCLTTSERHRRVALCCSRARGDSLAVHL